jgi:uncharacterized membrane protein YcjF (UPF0283 family)
VSDTEPLVTEAIANEPVEAAAAASVPRPRSRWGAVAWGLVVVLVALETLMIAGDPARRSGFVQWWAELGAGGVVLVIVLAVGGFILLQGVLALLRRPRPHA